MTVVTPLRFVSGVIGLWVAMRIAVLLPAMPGPATDPGDRAEAAGPIRSPPEPAIILARAAPAPRPAALPIAPRDGRPIVMLASAGLKPNRPIADGPITADSPVAMSTDAIDPSAIRLISAAVPVPSPSGILSPIPAPERAAAPSRWSGSLYVYRRGDGAIGLASGGQLGGSQAGARIAWRLNRDGPARFAAAARLSTPLDDTHGAEGAAGLDWHPLPGRPLRVSIERRVDLGGAGRNAWSAYAAGGFYREPRPGLVIDGYAQAGVVGARRRDPFADGALRGGARRALEGGRSLTLGAGLWGAAQPRVARLDIGPRAAFGLPVGGTATTLAAEWRIRVAGDASPRAGLALTLASDF